MSEQVSDFLLKRLSEWGVKRISGFPGDGILGALEPDLSRPGWGLEFKHEDARQFRL